MHISLDSALGRQKRLNSVGESVLQIAPDAAAAYSLRSLTGGDPDVVRVRRESDNTEKDFSGSQIESGEMARWVNEQPTLPLDLRELDTNTGERDGALIEAAAAYSLRKLKEDFTGDVVEVRRNVDGETEGFTAAEVTDGTLEDWVGAGNDGFVRTWYDQSGNTNDATQTDPTKQPKIVEGGNLLKDSNNKPEIDFDGTDDYFDLTSSIGFQGGGGCVISLQDPQSGASTATLGSASSSRLISFPDDSARWYFTTNAIDVDSSTTVSGLTLFTINHDGTTNDPNVKAFRDGSLMVATTPDAHQGEVNTSTVANQIGARRNLTYLSGVLKELIIYTTDQTDNRTALEANIGETYGITDIPAANDTVNGFVQTWYDQSGSGNDAVQISASSQPKIVGEVTSGQPHAFLGAIEFDGSQQFQTITLTSSTQPNSVFSVSNTNVAGQTRGIYGTNSNQAGYYRSSNKHAIYSSGTGAATLEGSAYVVDTDYLRFDLFNGANSVVGVNGTTTSGTTGDAVLNRLDIGDASLGGVNPLNGGIKELILYTDDQSANRTAIEANINNQYDIY